MEYLSSTWQAAWFHYLLRWYEQGVLGKVTLCDQCLYPRARE